jgi:alkylation response protein AidB-like acyl-CoA dehydrogenase
MRLRYDEETEAFRAELRAWLEENLPRPEDMDEPRLSSAHLPGWARAWQRRLYDAGWLVPGWPPELGGRNATALQQMVYFEEFAKLEVARAYNPQGLGVIAPSLYDFGTPEQQERWLVPTLRGDVTWCVGMSEPDAGSDLANLGATAVRQGDVFVVNGQKVWTSGAHHADWCLAYVRTDPAEQRHKGISVLVIDMAAPGITCRPLPELTDPDYADFNEVFFTDVEVPAENLLGPLHGGWAMAMGSLGHERGMLWIMNAAALERNIDKLRRAAVDGPEGERLADDPIFRDRLASLYIDAQALTFLGYRGFAKAARREHSAEHMLLKLYGSEVEQRLYLAATEALGAAALDITIDRGVSGAYGTGAWPMQYLRSFGNTIAGGTSEIQRNIIAERVLGLPRR